MMEYNNLGPFLRRTDLIDNFVDNQKLREQQKKPNRNIKAANQRRWEQYQAILRAELEAASMRCLLYTSPSPRDRQKSRMPSSA